jgi:hypothetical protein
MAKILPNVQFWNYPKNEKIACPQITVIPGASHHLFLTNRDHRLSLADR